MGPVKLPPGLLGMQLEPASGDTGLRLKNDWNGTQGVHLRAGDTILSVDGVLVTSRPFKEAVGLLRQSNQRLIEIQSAADENHDPNSLRSPFRQRNLPVMRSPLSPRRDVVNGPNVLGSSGKATKIDRTAYSSSSEGVAVVANLMEEVEKAKLLYDESLRVVQAKDELVGELTKEVIDLKSQTRGLDGQICLLKFQLVKHKRGDTIARSTVTTAKTSTPSSSHSASMHDWINHWRRLQVNLTVIRNRSAYNESDAATVSDDEPLKPVVEDGEEKQPPDTQLELIQSLTKRFTVEDRFAQRLQLPSGCNSAVKRETLSIKTPLLNERRTSFQSAAAPMTSPRMLKNIFDCVVADDESVKMPESSPLEMREPSTPTTFQQAGCSVPYGSADIRSAWKAWGAKRFTEVASSYSVNPLRVVFSPASVSPVTFREQMGKLRSENIKIREELSRFREGISRMQEEHIEQTVRAV